MKAVTIALALMLAATAPAQFDIQNSHTTASLRGIDNVGKGVAWASGTNGTVLRTEDGGYVWQLCAIPPGAEKLDFRGIQAFDANTAIVMSSGKGDLSRLYKTTDGCQTWKLIFTNPDKDGFWDALVFNPFLSPSPNPLAHRQGFLLGDPVQGNFVIYQSNDSGLTWVRWRNDKGERPASAHADESVFAASNSSLIVPGINGPFAFVTGGASGAQLFLAELHNPFDARVHYAFTIRNLELPKGENAGAFSLAPKFFNNTHEADLMIVGGDYQRQNIPNHNGLLVTHALTYFPKQHIPQTPPHGFRSAVAWDADQKLWITVGPNGTDISTDDGRNWSALRPGPQDSPDADKNWNALSLPYVVGPNGRIGKLRPINLNNQPSTKK